MANYGLGSFVSGCGRQNLTKLQIIALKVKGNESQTQAGAFFLAKLQAGGSYRGGAYEKGV